MCGVGEGVPPLAPAVPGQPARSAGEPGLAVPAARCPAPVPAWRGEIATFLPRCMCEEIPIFFFSFA